MMHGIDWLLLSNSIQDYYSIDHYICYLICCFSCSRFVPILKSSASRYALRPAVRAIAKIGVYN